MASEQIPLDSLKSSMLRLLKEDEEFRYAVAAYLGYHDILEKLRLHDAKFEEVLRSLNALEEDVATLKEDVATLKDGQRSMRAMLERLSLSLEEEAREVIGYLLRERGVDVPLSPLTLPEVEFDVFGTSDDVLVLGEATVRLGLKRLVRADEKIERFLAAHPEHAGRRIIKVIYAMWIAGDVREEAGRRGIWLIRSGVEETPLPS